MKTRYWKWVDGGQTWRVYRLKNGLFQVWKAGVWQSSQLFERAVQDPEFVEIGKADADVLIQMVGRTS